MADRRGRKSTTTEAPAEADTNTESESTVTENAVEVTETPAPTETKAPEAEVDLSAFKSAVEAAVAEADTATGTVPEASLAAVTEQYRALEGIKAKNAAKALVNDQMKDAMNANDLAGARANLNISEKALVAAAGGGSKPATPADPTENFVQRVATLTVAYQLALVNVPEGVSEDYQTKVDELVASFGDVPTSYMTWTKADPETRGDEPEVPAIVRNAAKLATGKSAKAGVSRGGGTFTGERHDIGTHIESAFSDKEEGTFLTIAEIRNSRSEEYGDNPPSAGAVSARLFPKSGKSSMVKLGINPTMQDGKKGALKVALPE